VFHRSGFLAGSSTDRAQDLTKALACPETRIIVCARGGVGSAELIDSLGTVPNAPKWLMGFSDFTAVHAGLQQRGWMSIHGPNVTSLGVGNAALRDVCIRHLLDPLREYKLSAAPLFGGCVSGPLVGGNLAVLHDLCVANAWHPPPGAILFLEEVAEAPYRIYRMLTAMRRGGHLTSIAGLLVGQVTHSPAGHHGVTARQVITQLCEQWALPAAWGLPSGHDPWRNDPLTFGSHTQLNVGPLRADVTFNQLS
jgi:muramoyltetrapeptide carboxypeptidase